MFSLVKIGPLWIITRIGALKAKSIVSMKCFRVSSVTVERLMLIYGHNFHAAYVMVLASQTAL